MTSWHAEKSQFQWAARYKNIARTEEAVEMGAFWAEFFVDLARRNGNPGPKAMGVDLADLIINKEETVFSGRKRDGTSFSQLYMFNISRDL